MNLGDGTMMGSFIRGNAALMNKFRSGKQVVPAQSLKSCQELEGGNEYGLYSPTGPVGEAWHDLILTKFANIRHIA